MLAKADSSESHIVILDTVTLFKKTNVPVTAPMSLPHLPAGPGLDQSGPDGEKISRVHFICAEGP